MDVGDIGCRRGWVGEAGYRGGWNWVNGCTYTVRVNTGGVRDGALALGTCKSFLTLTAIDSRRLVTLTHALIYKQQQTMSASTAGMTVRTRTCLPGPEQTPRLFLGQLLGLHWQYLPVNIWQSSPEEPGRHSHLSHLPQRHSPRPEHGNRVNDVLDGGVHSAVKSCMSVPMFEMSHWHVSP